MTCNKDSGNRGVRRLNLGIFYFGFFSLENFLENWGRRASQPWKIHTKELDSKSFAARPFCEFIAGMFSIESGGGNMKMICTSVSILGHTTTHWVVCPFWDTLVWVLGIHCSGDNFNSLSGVGWGVRSVSKDYPQPANYFYLCVVFICFCIYFICF